MISEYTQSRIQKLRDEHRRVFGGSGEAQRVVLAPFRICPIGAHVDHQLGIVSGLALENSIIMVFTPNREGRINLESANFADSQSFPLYEFEQRVYDWSDYARGASMALSRKFSLSTGIDAVLEGDLPIGGLSSSAAVGVAYIMALQDVNDIASTEHDIVELDRIIENDFIGLNNGILDQSVILLSEGGKLLYLDCLDGSHKAVEAGRDMPLFEITVVYSGVRKKLMDTDYNSRVKECEAAAAGLLELSGAMMPSGDSPKLRHVDPVLFDEYGGKMAPELRKRASHYFGECERVNKGIEAWRRGDLDAIGSLMRESGRSSIHNYECGCPPLITLSEIMNDVPGIYGARFSGAGFRGCCISLSDPGCREEISERVSREYTAAHPELADDFSINFCKQGGRARIL